MIKIYEPYKISNSLEEVRECIINSNLTFQNRNYEIVSNKISKFHNHMSAIPVFNGTCATHLAFKALNFSVKNLKRIIVPNNVYVAAWNSMLMDNLNIELIPIDADINTWCVDVKKLSNELEKSNCDETGVLIVHNVGGIVNVPALKQKYSEFSFIEDNCEGFLGEYENLPSGTASIASSISFYANKTITCGEGGALIVNEKYFDKLNRIQSQGQTSVRYIHDILAYNYRMTNIQATMLLSQFNVLDEILDKKQKIFDFYNQNLSKKFIRQIDEKGTKHSKWMFTIRLENFDYHKEINNINFNFETRPMFYPMSTHSHLVKYSNRDDEKIAKILSKECFMIPSHPSLTNENLEYIVDKLNGFIT